MVSLRSKIAIKILNYFFLNPGKKYYINEISSILKTDPKNTDRKLKELEKEGILKSEFSGKQRYFFLAKNFPLLKEYKKIILETYGIEQDFKKVLLDISGVEEAYIFGSYANGKMNNLSDIDMLIIGKHSSLGVQRGINEIQKRIGREINVVNMSREEFERKKKEKNEFIKDIFGQKIIKII